MRIYLFLLLSGIINLAYAETLINAEALKKIEDSKDWPVVDVRDLTEKSRLPIPKSLDYGPDLDITGKVLVVASDNNSGMSVAKKIESKYPGTKAFVIDGGFEALRKIMPELGSSKNIFGMPESFTIPSDTCQPGPPLHTFTDEKEK